MATFITDTPEQLKVEWVSAARSNLVVIVGDKTKILYEGEDAVDAKAVYDGVKDHYEKRVTERVKPNPKEPNNPALTGEHEVQYIPYRKPRF
jgi:hypothetical protein